MGWPKSLRDLAARREISAREWVVWKKWSGSVEVVIAIRGRWRGFVVFSKLMSRFRSANFMLLIESYVPRTSVISPQLLPSTLNTRGSPFPMETALHYVFLIRYR